MSYKYIFVHAKLFWALYLQQVLSDTIMIGYDPQPIKLCPATLTV